MVNEYSCVCLHSDRRPQERKENLMAFKVSFLPLSPFSNVDANEVWCMQLFTQNILCWCLPFHHFLLTLSHTPPALSIPPSLPPSLFICLPPSLIHSQNGEVRFLICTDVAARGIDITGIPYVINITLPDDKQNYTHRIGRVGRAEKMGLAISIVSTVKEKVGVV